MKDAPSRRRIDFPAVLAAIFFVVTLLQVSRHIMWRDELRPWQIILECSNPIAAINAMRYDSVPALWNLIVFVLTRITRNPFLMQLVHVVFATAVVWVVARWAPFPKWAKVLFAMGYFPFFEYAVITRNYVLVFLLMMIACVLISQPRVRLLPLGIVLALLTQVSIWGAGLAGLFLLTGIVKAFWPGSTERPQIWEAAVAGGLLLVGFILCYAVILPGPGPTFTATWLDATEGDKLLGMFAAIYRGLFPIPQFSEHFWNTNLLDGVPVVQAILGFLLLIGAIVLFIDRPISLGVLVLGILGLMLFEYKFKGSARHHGHIFMLLIAAWWLATYSPQWLDLPKIDRVRKLVIGGLLGLHALIGLLVAAAGILMPFSASWATAQFIRQNYDDKVPIVAIDDYCAAPIATWLDRPIYFPQMRTFAFCNTQNPDLRYPVDGNSILSDAGGLAVSKNTPVLLMLSSGRKLADSDITLKLPPMPGYPQPIMLIKVLPRFEYGVVQDESEALYLVTVTNQSP